MIDTHSHLYLEEFDEDRSEVVERAKLAGVKHLILPNVDLETIPSLLATKKKFPDYCSVAMGLHPTSVGNDYQKDLQEIERLFLDENPVAIGEVGIDLYWDKTFVKEQIVAFEQQLQWAADLHLPVIIHNREATNEILSSLRKFVGKVTGVFHCFSGNETEAKTMLDFGFKLGINGIVTFKKSTLPQVLSKLNINDLLIETDMPYLSPTPYRGKRNESAYMLQTALKLSEIFEVDLSEIKRVTTKNAITLFQLTEVS
ncbi:MAG: TatD family hydrolase [Paludibacteraceae bacterium]|nr:TatD family hydrolase [Paludibacteraceae bacterium]